MDIALILVPYDLGREGVGSGRGPDAYVRGRVAEALAVHGRDVTVTTARRSAAFTNELEAVIDVDTAVSDLVAAATRSGRLPVVLAGNCNVALGVHAGLATGTPDPATAVIWFDAHGDFNTPETTRTGYLDGMPLAMLTGAAHPDIWTTLGVAPLDERLALHAGGRDVDPDEAEALLLSDVITIAGADLLGHVSDRLRRTLDSLTRRMTPQVGRRPPAYLHVDIDVLDPAEAPGVTFPCPGGVRLAELLFAITMVRHRFELSALSLSSFTPQNDQDDATLRAGLTILKAAVAGRDRRP